MAVVGGIGVSGVGGSRPEGVMPWVIAGILVAGGAIMLLNKPWVMWVAVACSALLVASGAVAWTGHPRFALPIPPIMSVVLGLYLGFRSALVRPQPKRKSRFAPDPDDPDSDPPDSAP